jgi:NADPH:quinone reductase-like Zn-dependent oxidoreductase
MPSGFGSDFAGVVDEAGDGATGFAVGDRVYGGALGRAVADFVVVRPPADSLWHTPGDISDEVASTLPVAGLTAVAAGPSPPGGVRATGASNATPAALERVTSAILADKLTVPIAATFPVEKIRDAVALQAGRHVHGKIVVTL